MLKLHFILSYLFNFCYDKIILAGKPKGGKSKMVQNPVLPLEIFRGHKT